MDEFERLKKLIQEAYDIILAADEKKASQTIPLKFTEEDWDPDEDENNAEYSEPFNWSPDFFDQIDS